MDETDILEEDLQLAVLTQDGQIEFLSNPVIDPFANTVCGTTNHLSTFILTDYQLRTDFRGWEDYR